MTKEEFKQEAALRLINRFELSMADIAGAARELADRIYSDPPDHNPETDSIEVLMEEIVRVEEQEIKEAKEDFRQRTGTDYEREIKSSGIGIRLKRLLYRQDLNSVSDLLRYGRRELLKTRNVGQRTVERVDKALQNLYGIEEW